MKLQKILQNAETGITYDNSIWKVTVNVPEGF